MMERIDAKTMTIRTRAGSGSFARSVDRLNS
jgi:hypothetical protein